MGSCFGRCLPRADRSHGFPGIHLLTQQSSGMDFTFLMEENSEYANCKRSIFSQFFSKRKQKPKKPVLETLNPNVSSYSRLNESGQGSLRLCDSRDISLQCLDARALMARTTTSTPASSLDLEWEHEAVPVSILRELSGNSWNIINDISEKLHSSRQNATAVQDGDSDWSRVSSANSLEWDSVQHSLHPSPPPSDIDADTQLLLSEIERLTTQTLSETGLDLYS